MNIIHDTGYAVTWTARAFMKVAEARLRPMGLGVAHVPVLVVLAEDGASTQTQIAHRTHIEQPTAAALLQRMAKAGLIMREPHPDDGRSTLVRLSPLAQATMPEALAALTVADAEATQGLTPKEVETLNALLGRVLSNLEAMGGA